VRTPEELSEPLEPCQSRCVGRDTRESVAELRGIAALIVTGPSPQLVGVCTLVTNGTNTVAFSSADLLRAAGEPLAIALTLDCKKTFPVTAWQMSRTPHMGVIDLGTSFPTDPSLDVEPLQMGAVCASVDTRGAPSALVTVEWTGTSISRRVVPVHVDAIDGGDMSDDEITRLASPDDPADLDAPIDGAPLIAWMPADPVLGRTSEVVAVALGTAYRERTFKPRELPAVAELWSLDDLGRLLPWRAAEHSGSNDLGLVAGEIATLESGPFDLDVDREGD
jgi:hypothetical protein